MIDRAIRPAPWMNTSARRWCASRWDFPAGGPGPWRAAGPHLIFGPPGLAKPRWPASSPTRWASPQDHLRPGAGKSRGYRRPDDQPGARATYCLSTKSTGSARRRGSAVPGAGRLPVGYHDWRGPRRPLDQAGAAAFTLVGATTRAGLLTNAAAGSVRHCPAPGVLRGGGPGHTSWRALPVSWASVSTRRAMEIARRARGTPRSPIACCAGCGTTPR